MKILISGYYGFGNLGDEAILRVLVAELKTQFPDVELVVLSHRPELTSRRFGVRAIGRWSLLEIEQELQQASLFISGGGGLIQDKSSWRSPLYYLGLIQLAKRHCPVVMLGQGIGPISRDWVRLLTWRAVQAVDFAFVRDQESRDEMLTAGLDADHAISASDLVMLEWPNWKSVRESEQERTSIGISLTSSFPSEQTETLAKQLDQIHQNQHFETIFLVFNPSQDRSICEKVAALMESDALIFTPSLGESRECYAQLRYIIGMRFHSLVFSTLAARPFISIANDPKQEKLIAQLARIGGVPTPFPQVNPNELSNNSLNELIADLEQRQDQLREQLTEAGLSLYTETQVAMNETCREIAALLKLD